MKTFRFFGFVLSVVFLYVNFISCSNDDDKIEINENPYIELPQMVLMTYKMPAEIKQIALNP